jgi:hypothetical protein
LNQELNHLHVEDAKIPPQNGHYEALNQELNQFHVEELDEEILHQNGNVEEVPLVHNGAGWTPQEIQ